MPSAPQSREKFCAAFADVNVRKAVLTWTFGLCYADLK
ncbi:hypothetical protein [Klebsiella aerogenes EA1509E]|nr:hypothetical protein [Klebsiella aerogenes EA1509E]